LATSLLIDPPVKTKWAKTINTACNAYWKQEISRQAALYPNIDIPELQPIHIGNMSPNSKINKELLYRHQKSGDYPQIPDRNLHIKYEQT
jgi:hypothetical protein